MRVRVYASMLISCSQNVTTGIINFVVFLKLMGEFITIDMSSEIWDATLIDYVLTLYCI